MLQGLRQSRSQKLQGILPEGLRAALQEKIDRADLDIKAGQLVAVMYDGAEMQMLSQTGNAAAGGGGSASTLITTAGVGYWSPFDGGGAFITPSVTDRDLRV